MATDVDPGSNNKRRRAMAIGGVGEERDSGGPDLISSLPEGVIGTIISFLPTDAAVRVQVLSKRWRQIWMSSPLNICDGDIAWDGKVFDSSRDTTKIVTNLINRHKGPVRRLSLGWPSYASRIRYPNLNFWLQSPQLQKLEELDLWHCYARPHPLPPAALHLSTSLRALTIGDDGFYGADRYIKIDVDYVSRLTFPIVVKLTLMHVDISDNGLGTLLANCPMLESLILIGCVGFGSVQISSNTLRSFAISDAPRLIIQNKRYRK